MAASLRAFCRVNSSLLKDAITKKIFNDGSRSLFTQASLGLDGYINTRENVKRQFFNVEDNFRKKMKEFVDVETNMIFTEDLKAMLHLAGKNTEDIDLITRMMIKFNTQNKELRFGTYHFGPVVMRTLHYLDEPDTAFNLFFNPSLDGFFDQIVTYQILMDLLYNHKKYDDVKKVYDIIITKGINGLKHPKYPVVLVLAACYKQNTHESYEYAIKLWKELTDRGTVALRKAVALLGALALKQNAPHAALEITSTIRRPGYITIRCIKIAALANLDRVNDIIPYFRASLSNDNPNVRKESYFIDTIEQVEAAVQRANFDESSEIVKLLRQLKDNGHVQQSPMDEHLSQEIDSKQRETMNRYHSAFNDRGQHQFQFNRRPTQQHRSGLTGLV
ncbi:pentatricopeptide repeat-containing protein 2, mitochondrial [Cephus cinctus]|uniref:Pentatricopeptide repeat-containing protein 2, mitochondrial n=1 Tax=Cephus cinctus TaxID=211228 RepID=A0AAJ7BR57_CEPCN|nr:pentatricopeptide repeat-containing protein 2, mitochondrial [Cephus cinctus]